MKKSTKRLLLGAGIISGTVIAAGTVTNVLSKKLMSVALERDGLPSSEHQQHTRRVFKGNEYTDSFRKDARDAADVLKKQSLSTVTIQSYDGLTLVAHWYPCENAKRVIIAMHGWRSSWAKDFGLMAPFWHQQGCHVLFVEQRGQGASGGTYMGFGMTERFDCRDWAIYVNQLLDTPLPIYLVGMSMGAATVLMASSLSMPDNVKGIIADCGFTSAHAIWKHVVNHKMKLSYGLFQKTADDLCRKHTTFGSNEITAVDALQRTAIPVLFIHGTDDEFVPVTMTYENYKACASQKRLLVVPGADHAMSYFVDRLSYESAVRHFWDEFDT